MADATKSFQLRLADMRKAVPKPSEIINAVKEDAFEKAKELITDQETKRQAIKDSELVKHINSTRKNFLKDGVVQFEQPFGSEVVHREVTAAELEAEANLALVLIARDRKSQEDINSALGYRFPEKPRLHVEVLALHS